MHRLARIQPLIAPICGTACKWALQEQEEQLRKDVRSDIGTRPHFDKLGPLQPITFVIPRVPPYSHPRPCSPLECWVLQDWHKTTDA
jgi:hypothetical protein